MPAKKAELLQSKVFAVWGLSLLVPALLLLKGSQDKSAASFKVQEGWQHCLQRGRYFLACSLKGNLSLQLMYWQRVKKAFGKKKRRASTSCRHA